MTVEHDTADAAIAAALADVARLNQEAARLTAAVDGGPGTDLVASAGPGLPAEQAKTTMIELRAQATARARDLAAAQQRARDLIKAQQQALEARLTAMSDALAPLRRQADLLQDGIHALNLFLGTGEELVQLTGGNPASAGEPIRVFQRVLAMDEESAIAAESGGIDHMDVGRFDAWITGDWARVEQLIPAQRGVVAIMPRRSDKDYGDRWANQARNELNHATYLLIRNGTLLYRYIAEGFNVGRRLVPARDEFTSYFMTRRYDPATGGFETVRIEPGSRDWDRAEQAAGDRQRHYMKIALILQGLIERTACFHPLPAPGLSLLHAAAYESGHIVLIADDEHALTTGRTPFRTWLEERNAQLRPGMRVAGCFNGTGWRYANHNEHGHWRHTRVHPQGASHPHTGEIYRIERREPDGALVILYTRDDEVYKPNVPVPGEPGYVYSYPHPVPATQRASCRLYPADAFIIPVDLVTTEECEAYLLSRTDRGDYVDMFPVLKATIAAKKAEARAEEPMRQLLTAAIMTGHDAAYEEAAAAVPGLVDWWKRANRWHRPLVTAGDPKTEARAIKAISSEFAARRNAVTDDTEPEAVEQIRRHLDKAMLIARKKDGTWVALEPQPRRYAGEPGNVWARQHTWSRTLAGHQVRDWVLPEPSRIARWRVLWTSPAWEQRDQAATAAGHLTDPEILDITAAAIQIAAGHAREPYREFRLGDPELPLGGHPAAVAHHLAGYGDTGHRFTVYWLTSRPGTRGAELTVTWRRSTGGQITTEHGTLRSHAWTEMPWNTRNPLTFTDQAVIGDLRQALTRQKAAQDAEDELRRAAWKLQAAIAAQWETAARAAAYAKFVKDYGDPALWDDHSKGLRFDCPHAGHRGWEKPWERAIERLVFAGADLAALTVADMAALHAARFGEPVEVPEDLAGYRFPGPGEKAGP